MSSKAILLIGLVAAVSAYAIPSPIARSYRSLAMGGAYVAIADDRDAVHFNPAGLAQLGRKGTFKQLDSIGYWRERMELQWDPLGLDLPVGQLAKLYRYQDKHAKHFQSGETDTILNHPEIFEDLYKFDREPIPLNWHGEANWAMHNYGASAWGEIQPSVTFDHGALIPMVEIGLRTVQALEFATSRTFNNDRLSLGVGYRVAVVSNEKQLFTVEDIQDGKFTEKATAIGDSTFKNLRSSQDWGHGLDLGFLWFQTPTWRIGGAIQNVGMKIENNFVTPNLSLGTAWSPKSFQRNDKWGRKINFATSVDKVLDDENGYKPLSKIGIGMEWTQTLIPYVLSGRLSGGLKGGYPTFGFQGELFRLFHCEMVTYSNERGTRTGALEERYWLMKFGAGF